MLKQLFDKESTELVKPLCEALYLGHEAGLTLSILSALKILLDLDEQFKDQLVGIDSVFATVESIGGFDKIDQLASSH